MKTISTNHTIIESTGRDIIIGRALSSVLTGTPPVEQCPTTEQMAAFLDGTGMQEERDRFLGHLATCGLCREIYFLAHDLSKKEPVRQGRRGWHMAGGALAAAALVILAVKLTIQQPVSPGQQVAQAPLRCRGWLWRRRANQTASRPHKRFAITITTAGPFMYGIAARHLAHAATTDDLAAAIGAPASGSYGFAGSGSRQGTAFKAGKELFELELWLAAGDKGAGRISRRASCATAQVNRCWHSFGPARRFASKPGNRFSVCPVRKYCQSARNPAEKRRPRHHASRRLGGRGQAGNRCRQGSVFCRESSAGFPE